VKMLALVLTLCVAHVTGSPIVRALALNQCGLDNTQCQETSTDTQNGNNNLQIINQNTLTVLSTSNQLKVQFSYDPVKNQPSTSQAELTLVSVQEWNDVNSDGIPDNSELTGAQNFNAPTDPKWSTVGLTNQLTYVPYTASTELTNLNISCYMIKNQTYLFPDGTLVNGYSATCSIQVGYSGLPSNMRMAVIIEIESSLGSVGSSVSSVTVAPFTGLTGHQLSVGGMYFTWKDKSSNGASVNAGPLNAGTDAGSISIAFGLDSSGVSDFAWDFSISPINLNSASVLSLGVAFLVMLASLLLNV